MESVTVKNRQGRKTKTGRGKRGIMTSRKDIMTEYSVYPLKTKSCFMCMVWCRQNMFGCAILCSPKSFFIWSSSVQLHDSSDKDWNSLFLSHFLFMFKKTCYLWLPLLLRITSWFTLNLKFSLSQCKTT